MTYEWRERDGPLPIDPVMDFRQAEVRTNLAPPPKHAVWWLVSLRLNIPLQVFVETLRNRDDWNDLLIPEPYASAARGSRLGTGFFLVAYARNTAIDALNRTDGSPNRSDIGITDVLLGSPMVVPEEALLNAADPDTGVKIDVPDDAAVIGVIDTGIALGHDLFRDGPTSSRVRFAWIMEPTPGGGVGGVKWTKTEIDTALAGNTRAGLLDEAGFYNELGLVRYNGRRLNPVAHRATHGTHVLGLAAGYAQSDAVANRPIISVDLPASIVGDTSLGEARPFIQHALDYIREKAARFRYASDHSRRPPLVVNFSFGDFAGPHDGTGVIEQMLDDRLASAPKQKVEATLPAGNGNLLRCHAHMTFAAKGVAHRLNWRVLPDDRSASIVEIWMPFDNSRTKRNLVTVSVAIPGGNPVTIGTTTDTTEDLERDGVVVGTLSYRYRADQTERGVVTICISPTTRLGPGVTVPSGAWTITLVADQIGSSEAVDAYVQRDETLPGFPPFGRQSYFDNADYERFDAQGRVLQVDPATGPGAACIVRRAGAISGFATADKPSVLAGLIQSNGLLPDYSAAGPIPPRRGGVGMGGQDPTRAGPEAAARSDDSPVMHGVLSAGTHCGTMVAMNGTSVASPQAARMVAKLAAVNNPAGRPAVRDLGADGNGDYAATPPPPKDPRYGGGRINADPPLGSPRLGPD